MSACPARLSRTPSFFSAGACSVDFAPGRSPSLVASHRATKAGDLMRKVFGGLLAAAAAALLFVMPAWSAADPGQFVKNVTGQLADIARTKSGTSRDAAVREVLRNNFDLAHMARVALGGKHDGTAETSDTAG